MFRTSQDIAYNVTGQSLVLDCPSRPASVTSVSVFEWSEGDDTTAESATTGTAAIDSVQTIVDADSGVSQPDPHKLFINDTANIVVGRDDYLVTNATKNKEWVDVVAIDSGVSITSRIALFNDYASGDTIESTRITISVDSTWVADENNISDGIDPNPGYRVRWVWVDADSVTHVDHTFFDLVRVDGEHSVRPADVERLLPGWLTSLPRDHQEDRGRALIDEGYTQVQIDMHQEGIPDQQVRNVDIVNELTRRATIALATDQRVLIDGADPTLAQIAWDRYRARFDQLLRAPSRAKVHIGTDTTGAGDRRAPVGLTVR